MNKVKATTRAGNNKIANDEIGIPKRYRKKGLLEGNKIHDHAREVIQKGDGLFLTGDCGTGKTHLAVGLMLDWYADSMEIMGENNKITPCKGRPIFVTVPELLAEIRSSYSNDEGRRSESEADIINRYAEKPPLLVLDDLGAEKSTEWSKEVLTRIINLRYLNCKQTIITSNLDYSGLQEIDDRIASRVCEIGETMDLGSKDWRVELRKG